MVQSDCQMPVHGGTIGEYRVDALPGFQDATPVRIGNAAAGQTWFSRINAALFLSGPVIQ